MSKAYEHNDYMIVSDKTLVMLCETVKKFMVTGWVCVGGVAVVYDYNHYPKENFYQSLVRKSPLQSKLKGKE